MNPYKIKQFKRQKNGYNNFVLINSTRKYLTTYWFCTKRDLHITMESKHVRKNNAAATFRLILIKALSPPTLCFEGLVLQELKIIMARAQYHGKRKCIFILVSTAIFWGHFFFLR